MDLFLSLSKCSFQAGGSPWSRGKRACQQHECCPSASVPGPTLGDHVPRNPLSLPSAPCSVPAFLAVSLRCLSAPSARSHSDTSVLHELHPWNREADVTHLWKMTETSDQSRSGCRRSDRKSQERLLTLPVVPCLGLPVPYWWLLPERCWLARTQPKRPAPLPMLIVGQRGLVHDSIGRAPHTASKIPRQVDT